MWFLLYVIPVVLISILIVAGRNESITDSAKAARMIIPFEKAALKIFSIRLFGHLKNKIVNSILPYNKKRMQPAEALAAAVNSVNHITAQILIIIMTGSLMALMAAGVEQSERSIEEINRPEAGEGKTQYELDAYIEGRRNRLSFDIPGRKYTDKELKKLFAYAEEHMEEWILGDNESLDYVCSNLNLINRVPKTDIEVNWRSSDYTTMTGDGSLNQDNINDEAKRIVLNSELVYEEESFSFEIEIYVMRKKTAGNQKLFNKLQDEIKRNAKENLSKDSIKLPEYIENKKVSFYKTESHAPEIIFLMSIFTAVLIPFEKKALEKQKDKKRISEMMDDYPQIVHKLSLYLGAGLGISRAWEKTAETYVDAVKRHGQKRRHGYDEMLYTYRRLKSGLSKTEAYEEFGNRCDIWAYRKLALLINSNIKKGGTELSSALEIEAREAIQIHAAQIEKRAQEVSVKLLIPMMLELGVVMLVIFIPAFMNISL